MMFLGNNILFLLWIRLIILKVIWKEIVWLATTTKYTYGR